MNKTKKYKKALWVKAGLGKVRQAKPAYRGPKRISNRMAEKLAIYNWLRRIFLRESPICQHPACSKPSTDVHHLRGRAGSLLIDIRYWKALCRKCHNWVGDNNELARAIGLLCEKGKWGNPK